MFFVYILMVLTLLGVGFLLLGVMNGKINGIKIRNSEKTEPGDALEALGIFFIVLDVILFFTAIISFMVASSNQLSDFEEIRRLDGVEKVYLAKSEELSKEFAGYLAKTYPDLEKEIFGNMTSLDVKIYLVKYPELQSQKSISELVDKINKLKEDVYNQQIEKENVLKEIRFRKVNPWYIHAWIPDWVSPK